MQGHLPLVHNLAAGYLSTTQSAGATDSHSFSPGLHGAEHCLLHRPSESNPMLNLLGHRLGYQIGVQFRLLNLQDAKLNPLADKGFKLSPHLINPLPPSPDDDAGAGGMDGYRDLIRLAFNLHQGDTGFGISGGDSLPKLEVFLQEVNITLLGIPLGLPVADDP
ncbi:hypothetical protein ES703_115478 [subsurface metagenome]